MKTLGELRKLIVRNEGTFQIGALKFTYEADTDVDVHFDEQLIMWFSKAETDASLLSDGIFSIANNVSEARQALKEKNEGRREENKAKEFLAEAEKKIADAQNAIGKVEAYEKLLIGRDITISK